MEGIFTAALRNWVADNWCHNADSTTSKRYESSEFSVCFDFFIMYVISFDYNFTVLDVSWQVIILSIFWLLRIYFPSSGFTNHSTGLAWLLCHIFNTISWNLSFGPMSAIGTGWKTELSKYYNLQILELLHRNPCRYISKTHICSFPYSIL